jgi:hypothetical protein
MLLSIGSLAVGGLIAAAARSFALTDALIGYALAGLLLLAPFPLLSGDLVDAILLAAGRRRWLSLVRYQQLSPVVVRGTLIVVGMATYPVVLAVGGADLLGLFVVLGAFVLFGAMPIGAWLLRKARGRRSEP